jgi:hypothetical protein
MPKNVFVSCLQIHQVCIDIKGASLKRAKFSTDIFKNNII